MNTNQSRSPAPVIERVLGRVLEIPAILAIMAILAID
jgi:hypothetical protein